MFKDKKSKRIIKKYLTEKKCEEKFNQLIDRSNNLYFDVQYENGKKCSFDLGIISDETETQPPIYRTDEMGRNEKIFIDGDYGCVIKRMERYRLEEKIYDWQTDKRISFSRFIKTYLSGFDMKTISTLHNKLVIQEDEKFYLFSLKNIADSYRLLDCIEKYMREKGRTEALLVRDVSTIQRKWFYDVLVNYGFNREKLYRQTTTFSRKN